MKRIFCLLLVFATVIPLFVGCTVPDPEREQNTPSGDENGPDNEQNTPSGGENGSDNEQNTPSGGENGSDNEQNTPSGGENGSDNEQNTPSGGENGSDNEQNAPSGGENGSDNEQDAPSVEEPDPEFILNGLSLDEYTVVYSSTDPDYTQRAAEYLQKEIKARTGITLTVTSDAEQTEPLPHEIVVGETNRSISDALNAETEGFEFSMLADGAHIAIEGDFFVIAAAVYYFVETFVQDQLFNSDVPEEINVYAPIVEKPKNYIFLIGDGMGFNQTKLFDVFSAKELGAYSDGESGFYGYMFPYAGMARTNSLSGTTDSAAAATALATGYKTLNGYVGKDRDLNDVPNLVEIALGLGMATAVMSTETLTGATPASFTVHSNSRNNTDEIKLAQQLLTKEYGTRILGKYGPQYDENTVKNKVERDLWGILEELSLDEDGFFLMYEEAYIDKHSHSNELQNTFLAGLRFNQIIGCVMEFAFYHPETLVIITADHETGGLTRADDGSYYYKSGDHSAADVPVFAYGYGAEVFDGITVENIQIPKTIAAMWGVVLEGYLNQKYPSLVPVE